MFQSYKHNVTLDYNDKSNLHRWEYKIVDSEFEEIGIGMGRGAGIGVAVIDTYEKRNLNVAANLVKAFIWCSKKSSEQLNFYAINDIIKWNKQYNPKFVKYEAAVNKYLTLV